MAEVNVDVLNVQANTVNVIRDSEISHKIPEMTEERGVKIPETPTNRGALKIGLSIVAGLIVLGVCLPLCLTSIQTGGILQGLLMAGAIISFNLLLIPVSIFIDFRFYCSELTDSEIDDELAGKTVSGYKDIEEGYPELKAVRLSKTMSKKEKRAAANKLSKENCFDWLFWTLIGIFVVCLVCWIFYPVLNGTGIVTPALAEYINTEGIKWI